MKARQLAAVLVVAALGWPLAVEAQEEDARTAAAMEAHRTAGRPGEHHEVLGRMVGEWEVVVRMYDEPGAEPETTRGTSVTRWVMDGRFVEEELETDFMGAPFHGRGLTGYNNVTGAYEATWIDNVSTRIGRYEGTMDDEGRLVFFSEVVSPVTGERVESRAVAEFLSDDEMVFRSYEDRESGEVLTMELVYTRRS